MDDMRTAPSDLLEVLVPALERVLENGLKLREAVAETADLIARERSKRSGS
jgi:hypothetical protein